MTTSPVSRDDDRRRFPRFTPPVVVRFGHPSATSAGIGYDVSEGGIAFDCEDVYPVGTEIRVRFKLDTPLGQWFDAHGIVRHVYGNRMGVQFLNLNESMKLRLIEVIYERVTHGR